MLSRYESSRRSSQRRYFVSDGLCVAILLLISRQIAFVTCQESDPSSGKASQLLSCLPNSCTAYRTYYDHLLNDVPPCIAASRIWWSRHAPRLPITLVTQLSVNRLPALQAQCKSWAGPLAAAVYIPLVNPGPEGRQVLSDKNLQVMQQATQRIEQLMAESEQMAEQSRGTAVQLASAADTASLLDISKSVDVEGLDKKPHATCQLRIILVYEVLAHEKASSLYPVNSLRNYARLLADTPLIANIDVDMLASFTLSASLLRGWTEEKWTSDETNFSTLSQANTQPGSAGDLLERAKSEKAVFVTPALETSCGGPRYADMVSGMDKPSLKQVMSQNCTAIFRFEVAPACHNATNFDTWFSLPSVSNDQTVAYKIQYEDSFEPWFISSRGSTEWFDVRYKGYGKNKIQQVASTAQQAASFYVHPTGFIVHRPHDQSTARKAFLRIKFKSRHNPKLLEDSLYQYIEMMWEKHSQEIRNGTFKVMIDDTLKNCLADLSWWKGLYPDLATSVRHDMAGSDA